MQVDKGVPLPDNASQGKRKYPWKSMAVGDSFFTPIAEGRTAINTQATLIASGRRNFKLTTRTVTEGGVVGIRTWRVEE